MAKKLKYEDVKSFIANKGGTLLSDYKSCDTPLTIKCENGHIWSPTLSNLKAGKWCLSCVRMPVSIEQAQAIAKNRGGECLSTSIKHSKSKILLKCKEGHYFKSSFGNVKYGKTWCPYCSGNWRSEEICRNLLEKTFEKKFPKYRPFWLKNENGFQLELDGYCEELGIAFEHHGIQHFKSVALFNSNTTLNRNKNNDRIKKELCENNNVKLIVVNVLFGKTKLKDLSYVIKNQLINFNINIEVPEPSLDYFSKNDFCKKELNKIKEIARSKGGQCESFVYINSKHKLKFKCKNNHQWETTSCKIKGGTWCPRCARIKPVTITKQEFIDFHFKQGNSFSKTCKALKIGRGPLLNKCDEWGITPNIQKKLSASPEEMKYLYLVKKLTIKKISLIFNVNPKTITNFVVKHNLQRCNNKE